MNKITHKHIARFACLLTAVAGASGTFTASADDAATAPSITTNSSSTTSSLSMASSPPATTPPPAYQPFNLGAEVGTTGYGGTAGWRFADHFGLVGGADYFSDSLNKTISGIPYSAHLRLQTENAGIHLYPSKSSSFFIGLGAYFNQNQLTGSAVSDGTLMVNGQAVAAGRTVNLTYKQQPIDPYVSIGGNIYFDKGHHFSLGTELGAFYLGNPKVSASSNDGAVTQTDLNAYQQKAENDLKKIPVWPVLKISINYSF